MRINKDLVEKFIKSANWDEVWNGNFCQEETGAVEANLDYDTFNWECGATKMVILPVDSNEQYVIKVPFLYLYDEDMGYEDEDGEYWTDSCYRELSRAPRPKFSPFDTDWDYCETEVEYCELAEAANISEFFPETIKYCETPYPVYLQELCELSHFKPHMNNEERTKIYDQIIVQTESEEIARYCYEFMASWLVAAVKAYGLEKLIELFKFMGKYHMKDFHSANYGYRKSDGTPVLIDFAGFYEE